MLAFLTSARADLAAIHPVAPAIALALTVGAVIYTWRKLHPTSFERIPKPIQSLPAVLLSALVAALSSGGDGWQPVLDAIAGVFVGLVPIGGHHLLKAAPGSYVGGSPPAASDSKPSAPTLPLLMLVVLPLVTGCGGATQAEIKHAAECATLDEFYAAAAQEIVATGICDSVVRVEQCVPYAALEELYVQSAKARRCVS